MRQQHDFPVRQYLYLNLNLSRGDTCGDGIGADNLHGLNRGGHLEIELGKDILQPYAQEPAQWIKAIDQNY